MKKEEVKPGMLFMYEQCDVLIMETFDDYANVLFIGNSLVPDKHVDYGELLPIPDDNKYISSEEIEKYNKQFL